jgi:two-component system, cell cycle response regulator
VKIQLNVLQNAPFQASPSTGGSPARAAQVIRDGKRTVARTLAQLRGGSSPAALDRVDAPLQSFYAAIDSIYTIGASGLGYGRAADRLAGVAGRNEALVAGLLDDAGRDYDSRASSADTEATVGSIAVIVLLLAGFGVLYRGVARARASAERLARENARLLEASREDALTDALTGLRNRRGLMLDLEAVLPSSPGSHNRFILALYDLDGFKQYNDTFGHPAGDALLVRLGERLRVAVAGAGGAYRMGGDEFCVLVPVGEQAGERIVHDAADALTEEGERFTIGCSYGAAYVPLETSSPAEALMLADQRMYENKAGGASASQQSADVLIRVFAERLPQLSERTTRVCRLARRTAERLGLPEHDVKTVALAGQLHDIGKTAIPDAVLGKAASLDAHEWEFIRRHTIIGERIVRSAPALAQTAKLIRSSHERMDGAGYPDGLIGEAIPIGARIIAVCDAFDAMTSERPYRAARSPEEALAELRGCAGTQFDAEVVDAFLATVAEERTVAAQ